VTPCTGVILAGGAASRYGGQPKGLERVGGRRVIDRVADALREAADELLLIANDPAAHRWLPDVRTAPDVRPQLGSLGGIHAAIVRAAQPVLVVAWDMPFVPSALLRVLRHRGSATNADAVLPESGSRRGLEPLCAYYSPACVPAIERRLDANDMRVVSFFEDVYVERVPEHEVRRFGDPAILFMNVNTPDDLTIAERHAADDLHRRAEA
jgi:molybdopterin-guanine dinucleotide biosynthesis protein A